MNDELVIDETNFSQYFRDCRISRPQRGDVMAKYTAIAELVGGRMKTDLIDLLVNKDKAFAATQVMRKLGCASQKDAIRVCREIAEDLAKGLTPEQVEQKTYEYEMEAFYYTKKEYVPLSDSHWCIIGIENLDSFLDSVEQKISMKARMLSSEECSNIGPSNGMVCCDGEAAQPDEAQI